MSEEPDVLTVLFTDLVGSTALLSALGDDAADVLRRGRVDLLRRAVADHRGREVESLGDGLMVAFSSAREAVACAAAMQVAVTAGADRLELRVGIDAGEPIHGNRDLFGTPVVVARRLCDVAAGGQVLVSDTVRLLSGRRLGVPLEALGPVALKGFDEPVVAHAVLWRSAAPRVRLCGGLAIEHEGARLDERLASRQARLLFALLALNRSRALTRDAIADALWPRAAPLSRDSSLRALLSGVRRVFGPDSIEGRDSVRLLLPQGTTIDVEEAEAALAEAEAALGSGDHPRAAQAARRATALTEEELLAGLSAPWIDERRASLDELSLRALEIEAQAALKAGRSAEAERSAHQLVERAPYRESAYALLMEALAARGNLALATLAYDRLRTLLREELGTVPAEPIVALHDRLLAGDTAGGPGVPATALPMAVARAAARPFVARAQEVERLRQAWAAARGGDARIVLLAGEPGIGKTSLAAQIAREAHEGGGGVLLGRCHPEALVPYEPFVEALRQLPGAVLSEHVAVLGRVMPELAPEGQAPAGADDQTARYLLFDAAARALAAFASDRPLVLLLEDLHWADPPTLLLLRHVARAADGIALLVLATYRTTEVDGTQQVLGSVSDLARELPLERITLAGLGDDEVADLIRALDGRPSSVPLGSAMRRDTAGNPLFVTQLLRHLGETGVLVERDGELSLAAPDRFGVPDSVRELVAARLKSLDDATVSALRTAAVIGRAFDHRLVAAVEDHPSVAILDALDAAVAAGLVEEARTGHSFVHALVRDAIRDQLGAARSAALHQRVGEALEAAGEADPAELAHHFLAAGDRANGAEYSVASARRALERLAYEDAVVHYAHALDALGNADPPRRCELLLDVADAHSRAGDTPAGKRAYREAAELADALSLPEPLARAAVGYGGRLTWEVSRDDHDLVPMLERALDRIGDADSPLRVRLLARLGGGPLRDDHDPTRRRAITAQALEAARRLGDPATLAYALDGYISARHNPDFTPRQPELATELLAVALKAGDLERAIEALEHRAAARLELGDAQGSVADVEAMAPLAAELRQPAQHWFVAERRAVQALHEGRLADAEALMEEAREVGSRTLAWSATVCHLLQAVVLRRLQGRLEEVEPDARAAAEDYAATYPICRCAHVHILAALGERDEARAGLEALARERFAALDFDETWLAAVAFLAEAAHDLDDAESAATLYELLSPYADRIAVSTPEVSLGGVPRYLGLLAAASGRPADAVRHFEAAVAFDARTGARACVALVLEDHAALAADRALATRAVEAYAALGMDVLAERARARLLG